MQESLLQNTSNKYTIFPIQYPDIWEMAVNHRKAIWYTDHIDLTTDLKHWSRLSQNEQHFIKHVLAFFAASDGIVMENLASRFCNEIQIAEVRSFYATQMFIEDIHSHMYSLLIETYITDSNEKHKLFNAIDTMPAIMQKAQWAQKWITSNDNFATRLVAFALVEGVFFSGSFCAIYWLYHERHVMPGLYLSNQYISRDEGLHTDFACLLYRNYIQNKLSQDEVNEMVQDAIRIEKEFIINSLPCALLGMNSELMSHYIEFVANRIVKQLGHDEIFPNAIQPFEFMDRICLPGITNFFDSRETNYQQSIMTSTEREGELDFSEDF